MRFADDIGAARSAIVRDVIADLDARPEGSRLVLAHRRVDVAELNMRSAPPGRSGASYG